MAIGIYKALRRHKEADSTLPNHFTNNLQIWLSVFAFSIALVSIFTSIAGGLRIMYEKLAPIWYAPAVTFAAIFTVLFLILAVYALYKLLKLIRRAWLGTPIEYDPKTTPDNILLAIDPVFTKGQKNEEYLAMVGKLNTECDELVRKKQELVNRIYKAQLGMSDDEGRNDEQQK